MLEELLLSCNNALLQIQSEIKSTSGVLKTSTFVIIIVNKGIELTEFKELL